MHAKAVNGDHGYRLDSGHVLDLHPDGVRIAAGVFEVYMESAGAEEAMARALVAYTTWLERFTAEERRRGLVDFKLPDGRIVGIHSDVARHHMFLEYQLTGGEIVLAERVR